MRWVSGGEAVIEDSGNLNPGVKDTRQPARFLGLDCSDYLITALAFLSGPIYRSDPEDAF